jgi:hypothetical protein
VIAEDSLDKLTSHLERLRRDTEKLTQMVDGSGLRLSQRTLQAMKSIERFFDPYEFDWDRYKILLSRPMRPFRFIRYLDQLGAAAGDAP